MSDKRAILLARLVKAREAKLIKGRGGGSSKIASGNEDELLDSKVVSPIKQKEIDAETARQIAREKRAEEARLKAEREKQEAMYMRNANAFMGIKSNEGMTKREIADDKRKEMNYGMDGSGIDGGALSAKELKGLLGASYDPKIDKVGDFILDSKLSTKTSKVYHNPNSGQTVVAHKGTEGILDWGNNAVYALGGKTAYKLTPRYKEAEKVQKQAEKKYGRQNVSTIGHSQGGLQAELLGGKSKEIITLNKATRPFESNTNKNQYDVRSGRDVVSALNPFEKKSSKNIEIEGESYNPLAEHSGDVLDRLNENQMIGEGIRRMMEGGATPQQRNIAGFLRSRITSNVAPFLDPSLPYDPTKDRDRDRVKDNAWFRLKGLLHSIVHSIDSKDEISNSIKSYKLQDFLPAYTDYEDRENYIDPNVPEMIKGGISNKTLPDDAIQMALEGYIQYLLSKKETNPFQKRGNRLGIDTGESFPMGLAESKYFSRDLVKKTKAQPVLDVSEDVGRIEKREAERGYVKRAYKDAYWTDNKVKQKDALGARIGQIKDFWNKGNEKQYNATRAKIITTLEKIDADIEKWVDEIEADITDEKTKDDIYDKVSNDSPFDIDDDYHSINWNIPLWNAVAPRTLRIIKGEEVDLPAHIAPAKVGKGLPTSKIDFEDINWGSLTEQMNASHSKDFDLEGFARMIIADPSKFQKRTLKRARFYINVLLPKKK